MRARSIRRRRRRRRKRRWPRSASGRGARGARLSRHARRRHRSGLAAVPACGARRQQPLCRARSLGVAAEPRTFSERLDDLDALQLLEREHPDAAVRALAADARADELRLLGQAGEAAVETARLQFISHWKLIGAFDNQEGRGFSSVLPPEQGIELAAMIPGAVVPVGWRSVEETDRDGAVPLGSLVSPSQEAVAYLLTYINVAQDTAAQLRVSTPAPLIAWVNDGEVAREERLRRGGLDNVVIAVQLRAGWNKLLLKSAVKKGAGGRPRAHLSERAPLTWNALSAEPHPSPQVAGKAQPATRPPAASARERLVRARDSCAAARCTSRPRRPASCRANTRTTSCSACSPPRCCARTARSSTRSICSPMGCRGSPIRRRGSCAARVDLPREAPRRSGRGRFGARAGVDAAGKPAGAAAAGGAARRARRQQERRARLETALQLWPTASTRASSSPTACSGKDTASARCASTRRR